MSKIIELLAFPFAWYSLIVGALISLCSSLLGVTLVLKRFSFIGDGLSHVAFGAMTVAAIVGLTNDTYITLPVTILCAILLLKTSTNARIKGDAAVAMISVGALALGYLFLNIAPYFNPSISNTNLASDVCGVLFGVTMTTLNQFDLWVSIVLSVVVVVVFIVFYNKIFAVTFDENFAKATGTKTTLYNLIIAVIIAVIIVLAMNLVGSLLISALVIFPALSAMRVFKSFKSVTICSACVSVVCSLTGILISMGVDTPVGSTIVAVDIVVFGIFFAIGAIKGAVKK